MPVIDPAAGAPVPGSLPEQFGRYRILRRLGQGGMGLVYLAHDSQLDRQVALKVPRFTPADGPSVLERFHREARAAAQLRHPNICPVYDVGEIDGTHYLTMAYIEGRPLADVVAGGRPQQQTQAAAVVRKIALALEEAHKHGVIHRDLKPANVMLNKAGEPAVMDFGLAKRLAVPERPDADARLTRDGAMLGTPAYMPPEQVQGDVEAMRPASDIYSLGVILYELLTGRRPFQGSLASILGQIMTQEPDRPSALRPDLHPELERIVLKAMAKQPEKRFASMAELAAALTEFLRSGSQKPAAAGPAAAIATRRVPAAEEKTIALQSTRIEQQAAAHGGRGWVMKAAAGGGTLLLGGIILVILINQGDKKPTPDENPLIATDDSKQDPRGEKDKGPGTGKTPQQEKPATQEGAKSDPGKPIPPQRQPDFTHAPELEGLKLPLAAAWDTRGFEPFFRIKSAAYDETTKELTWTVETKRGFARILIQSETKLDVDFLDADNTRLDRLDHKTGRGLDYLPGTDVKQDDRVKITLRLPQSRSGTVTVMANTAKVVIRDPNKPVAAEKKPPDPPQVVVKEVPKQADVPAQEPDLTGAPELKELELPFRASWDTTAFRPYFKVQEASYDPAQKTLTWTVVTTRGFPGGRGGVASDTKLEVDFYDGDDVRLNRLYWNKGPGLDYTPEGAVPQGSKVKITLHLPREDILRKTARVVLSDRNKQELPLKQPLPQELGPAKDPAFAFAPELEGADLPLQAAWDTRALRSYFTVLQASYDAENKELSWLLEAKRGFRDYVASDTKLEVDFYDADDVRLDRLPFNQGRGLKYTPESDLAERGRVRMTLRFVHEDILRKTARLVIIDPLRPVPKKN